MERFVDYAERTVCEAPSPPPVEQDIPSDLPYRASRDAWAYLEHGTYAKYQRMHKMFPGSKGASQLESIAEALAVEADPRFLTAAASAYLEAAIVKQDHEKEERLELVTKAQATWERALGVTDTLRDAHPELVEYTDGYRIAMSLACLPMVRGMVEGDVKEEVIQSSTKKLLQIADVSVIQMQLALQERNMDAVSQHVGMQHEINALVSFLYRADPRFIAIPSSDRAGAGFYYQEQTHDITVISQHYGELRSTIPVEVKATASKSHRDRYKALIIRGKMHLSLPNLYKPQYTKDAYERCLYGDPTEQDLELVTAVQQTVNELMSQYKQGGRYEPLQRKRSKTHYYNPVKVAPRYSAA